MEPKGTGAPEQDHISIDCYICITGLQAKITLEFRHLKDVKHFSAAKRSRRVGGLIGFRLLFPHMT